MSTLYEVPLARRAQAGAVALALALALVVAGIAPLIADAPAWLRIAGVLLLLIGLLIGLIGSGLRRTVRVQRRHDAARQVQFEIDAAAAAVCANVEAAGGLAGSPCGPEGCGGACSLGEFKNSVTGR